MRSTGNRRVAMVALLGVLLAAMVLVPALAAAAVPGDSLESAVELHAFPWSQDATGTLNHIVDGADEYYEYWHWFSLTRGQTVKFIASTPNSGGCLVLFSRSFDAPMGMSSDYVRPGIQRLTFMAPQTGSYFLGMGGSVAETFTITAIASPAVRYKLAWLSVPKSAKRSAKFTLSVSVLPDYDSIVVPIRFFVERKSGSKWKKYGSVATSISDGSASYSEFWAQPTIAKKGTFRIRAGFADAANPKMIYSGWKSIKIK